MAYLVDQPGANLDYAIVLFDKILEPERALETMILQQVQVLKLAQVSVNAALLQLESGANHREET